MFLLHSFFVLCSDRSRQIVCRVKSEQFYLNALFLINLNRYLKGFFIPYFYNYIHYLECTIDLLFIGNKKALSSSLVFEVINTFAHIVSRFNEKS